MRRRQFLAIACVVATFTLLCSESALAEFRAAVAVRCITPDPLLPVSGGVGPSNPTTKKLGELTVRAWCWSRMRRASPFAARIFSASRACCATRSAQVSSVPAENILIGATHTHSAPDCYGFPDRTGKTSCDLGYLDTVCTALAQAIDAAAADLHPASVKIATGNAQGKIAYNYYAEKLYDARCHVLQVVDRDRKPIATLVNYACHPEVIGPDQGILSPDFVGPLYDRIETQGGGTGIFMNSAQGGMVTADCRGPDGKDIQTWSECVRIGHLLADEALRIVNDAAIQDDPALLCKSATVRLPVENDMLRTVVQLSPLGFKLDDDGCVTTRINLVNLGDAQMVTIPGEALPNIGYYLKRKMHGRHNFLLGLTNDAFGYILTKEDFDSFDRYAYITRTCLGEHTGEILVTRILDLVNTSPHPVAQ